MTEQKKNDVKCFVLFLSTLSDFKYTLFSLKKIEHAEPHILSIIVDHGQSARQTPTSCTHYFDDGEEDDYVHVMYPATLAPGDPRVMYTTDRTH